MGAFNLPPLQMGRTSVRGLGFFVVCLETIQNSKFLEFSQSFETGNIFLLLNSQWYNSVVQLENIKVDDTKNAKG